MNGEYTRYRVNDVYPSVQGEGVNTGLPMVILRLHGCPVGCPFCDTKETWENDKSNRVDTLAEALGANPRWVWKDAKAIAQYIENEWPGIKWVMITGGEPAMENLEDLTAWLRITGKSVALETSGTALGHLGAFFDWICVSPKIGMPGGLKVLPEALMVADEIKYVVGKASDLATFDELLSNTPELKQGVTICLQPMSASKRATELCMKTVMERGWRLSIQTHRLLEVR